MALERLIGCPPWRLGFCQEQDYRAVYLNGTNAFAEPCVFSA
jgi:hypothetical protein